MASSALTTDFTKGSIPKLLLAFTLPFMASNALQVLYSTIDMIIVGKYVGSAGLSAVSQSSSIVNFAAMLCMGFANAGQILVAQALGAGKRREMSEIIGTLFCVILMLGALLTGVILTLKTPLMSMLNMPPESRDMALTYLIICGAGLLFTAGYNMVSAVLRGMGDSKRPFLFIAIASLVNLVLDILFTGFLGWGVAGAAAATIIGQAVSLVFSICFLYRNRARLGFHFEKKDLRVNRRYAGMILSLGAPMAVQSGFINLSMLYVNSLVNSAGVIASATFGVGVRIDDIGNKLCLGLQYAASPMVGQNIAAGEQKRVRSVVYYTWLFAFIFTIGFILVYAFFGRALFGMFTDDPEVLALSKTFISAILWSFPAFALMRGSNGFIQGIGNAKLGMVLSILDGVVLRIGLSWLIGIRMGFGFYGFVLGYALAPYGCVIPGSIYFLSGIWKKRRVLADAL